MWHPRGETQGIGADAAHRGGRGTEVGCRAWGRIADPQLSAPARNDAGRWLRAAAGLLDCPRAPREGHAQL